MKAVVLRGMVIGLLCSLLVACGGGGSGSSAATTSGSNVYISGTVNKGLWPVAGGGTQLQNMATVVVATSTFNGTAISNASVSINGTQLVYSATYNSFRGVVVPDAAGKFVLTVVANGETHTATAVAITSLPVITVPNPFPAAQANSISWTAAGGVVAGLTPVSYYIEVVDYNNTGANRLAYSTSTANLSTTVPANATTATTPYYASVYASYISTMIATAASGSNFGVSASAAQAFFTPQ